MILRTLYAILTIIYARSTYCAIPKRNPFAWPAPTQHISTIARAAQSKPKLVGIVYTQDGTPQHASLRIANKTHVVCVGDRLPDSSFVTALTDNHITLERNGKRVTLS